MLAAVSEVNNKHIYHGNVRTFYIAMQFAFVVKILESSEKLSYNDSYIFFTKNSRFHLRY